MDSGTILGFISGYFATGAGVFLLYLPLFVPFVALLVAAGVLQLLLLPFVILIRKLRPSKQEPDMDAFSLLSQAER
jgi:hypothetical protein